MGPDIGFATCGGNIAREDPGYFGREVAKGPRNAFLASIQDIAGVRFEAEMSLDEQDRVVRAICGLFEENPSRAIHDLRRRDHSGYRAVHVWLRRPWRAEIQVRTHLQGEWANMYESAADFFGRRIRYDELPANVDHATLVSALREMSTVQLSGIEDLRNEAESLRRENAEALRGLAQFDIDDTLPKSLGDALDIRSEIDERLGRARSAESEMRSALVKMKSMFDALVREEK